MERMEIKAYAKINLSIDVLRKLPDGYHQVEMVMQQVDLYDTVTVGSCGDSNAKEGKLRIQVASNRGDLPSDRSNLAYRAAELMVKTFGREESGLVEIQLWKRIPIAAGLAGGSADGAAVLHGLNALWRLDLPLRELMLLGGELGADVPFCVMGQAALNPALGFAGPSMETADPLAVTCALATGTGKDLEPAPPLMGWTVLSKPPISVSTAEVYEGLKLEEQTEHPDTNALLRGLHTQNRYLVGENMKNLLESVTLFAYPEVRRTKELMERECRPYRTLMSGSGPTVFGLFFSWKRAEAAFRRMKEVHAETCLARLL